MKEFEFVLKFLLPAGSDDVDAYLDTLAAAGCNDAIAGIGQKGSIALQFTREAENAFDAVLSAIKDVKKAIPDAQLIEATPDLVGLSDVAELVGFSRQNLRKLMIRNSDSFPIPVHAGKYSIWHLCKILHWLEVQQNKHIDPAIKEIALANMQINITRESASVDKQVQSRLAEWVL